MKRKSNILNSKISRISNSVCMPIIFHNKSTGAIFLANKKNNFTKEDIRLLELLESQIDSAVEHKKVFKKMEQKNKELTVL